MYSKAQLSKHPYFEELFKSGDESNVIDSLTGLISRRYMEEFIQYLVDNNVPFSLALLDLDNFKFINDTYGHRIGDGVLTELAKDLERYLGDYGIAGRYGGDEFLIVNLRDHSYDEVKAFFVSMYANFNVLRKNNIVGEFEPFVTGTIGCAVYPKDAQNYASLFGLVDKTLYRGKTKGRNCYIIYVEEKHKDISIQALASRGIYTIFHDLSCRFDSQAKLFDKLKSMLNILATDMRISDLYYVTSDNRFISVSSGLSLGNVTDLDLLTQDNIYSTNEVDNIKSKSDTMFKLCRDQDFETVLMIKIGIQDETFGYLVCAERNTHRIWQEDEHAIMFFVSRMLAVYMQASGEKI